MKKYSVLIAVLMLLPFTAYAANEIRIENNQEKFKKVTGTAKIVWGSAFLVATFLRGFPQVGYRGLKKDWSAFWNATKIEGRYDDRSLCCSTMMHSIVAFFPLVPAYVIVDGLNDLHFFEAIKKRIKKNNAIYIK